MRAHPDMLSKAYGRRIHSSALFRVKIMIERRNDDLMPNETAIAEKNPALILKTTT